MIFFPSFLFFVFLCVSGTENDFFIVGPHSTLASIQHYLEYLTHHLLSRLFIIIPLFINPDLRLTAQLWSCRLFSSHKAIPIWINCPSGTSWWCWIWSRSIFVFLRLLHINLLKWFQLQQEFLGLGTAIRSYHLEEVKSSLKIILTERHIFSRYFPANPLFFPLFFFIKLLPMGSNLARSSCGNVLSHQFIFFWYFFVEIGV